jgi:hypothetical protein
LLVDGKRLKRQAVEGRSTSYAPASVPVYFRNVDNYCNCEYTPNYVNISERDVTLPGHSKVSLAAAT